MRRIIQITTTTPTFTERDDFGPITEHEETMYALCDDGTVWYSLGKSPTLLKGWRPLVDIPQHAISRADNEVASL